MKVWKILFICILHFLSEVDAQVAPNIEPFLWSSQGVYIENGGFWKEYTNSSKALQAYEDQDPIFSRFYPKLIKHGEHGQLVYFECGGGYPKTVIEVYGKGYLHCGPFNGTPTRKQLFKTFDSTNGTIIIWPITSLGLLTMRQKYPFAGSGAKCHNDNCRFNLVYPPNKLPIFEMLELTINSEEMKIDSCHIENLGEKNPFWTWNENDKKENVTHQFVANRTMTHTTNWSYKFGLNYQFEKTLNISKIWSGVSDSIIIGFDDTIGISFLKKDNVTFKKTVTMELDPRVNLYALFRAKVCKVKVPFMAKIHRTEFDTLTGMPIYSNLTEHGFWKGPLLDDPYIECWMEPKQNQFNKTNEIPKFFPQSKECRIFEDEEETVA